MTGVVLSGGESRRMGTDKGLLLTENKSWVQRAYDKLSAIASKVVISLNSSQYDMYSSQFSNEKLVCDNGTIHVNGPLHGLLSVHVQFPKDTLLVLACDMFAMDNVVLLHLAKAYNDNPGYDCYTYQNENGYQPLAGIYTDALLSKILQQSEAGALKKFSMKHVLDSANSLVMDVPEHWNKYFVNYNYKEDIDFQ
jgi:molybdopterin-guanine dinucleotide biosynthesis protein A